jgi:hypothetical protein
MKYIDSAIFHTDIFRYRSSEESDIAYNDGMTFRDSYYFNFRIGKLLESLLLYDVVYVDLDEIVPIIFMLGKERDALNFFITNGNLRLMNRKVEHVGAVKHGHMYTLATKPRPVYRIIKSINDICNLLDMPGWGHNYYDLAQPLYNTMMTLKKDFDKQIVKGIENDFKDKKLRERIGINAPNPKMFFSPDVTLVNRISEFYLRTIISTEVGINNIYADDVLIDLINIKLENFADRFDARVREGLVKVVTAYNVPSIPDLYNSGILTVTDVLELKQSEGYEIFRKWLTNEIDTIRDSDINEITASLYTEVEKKTEGFASNPIVRTLRIAASIGTGFAIDNPFIGAGLTLIDSVIIESFLKRKSAKLFLDQYKSIASRVSK